MKNEELVNCENMKQFVLGVGDRFFYKETLYKVVVGDLKIFSPREIFVKEIIDIKSGETSSWKTRLSLCCKNSHYRTEYKYLLKDYKQFGNKTFRIGQRVKKSQSCIEYKVVNETDLYLELIEEDLSYDTFIDEKHQYEKVESYFKLIFSKVFRWK